MDGLGAWDSWQIGTNRSFDPNPECHLNVIGLPISSVDPALGYRYVRTAGVLSYEELARFAHCSYEIKWMEQMNGGIRLKNGTWTGVFGAMQTGHLDLVTYLHGITPERYEHGPIIFSNPILISQLVSILSMRSFQPVSSSTLLDLASPLVWALLIGLLFFLAGVSAASSYTSLPTQNYLHHLLVFWQVLLIQPVNMSLDMLPQILAVWMVTSWIMVRELTSNLLSVLTHPATNQMACLEDLYGKEPYSYLKILTDDTLLAYKLALEVRISH